MGVDINCYFHPEFRRDNPECVDKLVRINNLYSSFRPKNPQQNYSLEVTSFQAPLDPVDAPLIGTTSSEETDSVKWTNSSGSSSSSEIDDSDDFSFLFDFLLSEDVVL